MVEHGEILVSLKIFTESVVISFHNYFDCSIFLDQNSLNSMEILYIIRVYIYN